MYRREAEARRVAAQAPPASNDVSKLNFLDFLDLRTLPFLERPIFNIYFSRSMSGSHSLGAPYPRGGIEGRGQSLQDTR